MRTVTRTVLIIGLMVLAAVLPLAVLPFVIVVVAVAVVVVADAVPFAGPTTQPVALLALALFRAPPSR